ncbi:unnamed protein product [Soboliphyme baturini]|uniref:Exocyst complex component Sec8 n=1 Tax=Soboliphyme baturini TaxID=241478 RepID=A0A183J3T4_9BILA|nr:unnamed protein product [Soboliphyme baturini]
MLSEGHNGAPDEFTKLFRSVEQCINDNNKLTLKFRSAKSYAPSVKDDLVAITDDLQRIKASVMETRAAFRHNQAKVVSSAITDFRRQLESMDQMCFDTTVNRTMQQEQMLLLDKIDELRQMNAVIGDLKVQSAALEDSDLIKDASALSEQGLSLLNRLTSQLEHLRGVSANLKHISDKLSYCKGVIKSGVSRNSDSWQSAEAVLKLLLHRDSYLDDLRKATVTFTSRDDMIVEIERCCLLALSIWLKMCRPLFDIDERKEGRQRPSEAQHEILIDSASILAEHLIPVQELRCSDEDKLYLYRKFLRNVYVCWELFVKAVKHDASETFDSELMYMQQLLIETESNVLHGIATLSNVQPPEDASSDSDPDCKIAFKTVRSCLPNVGHDGVNHNCLLHGQAANIIEKELGLDLVQMHRRSLLPDSELIT